MNVLQCNNFTSIRGGSEKYVDFLSQNLKKVNTKTFSTDYCLDECKDLPKYFDLNNCGFLKSVLLFPHFHYNYDAKSKLKYFLSNNHTDVIHLHNIYHHLSTSILDEIKKARIPCVMTVHDYYLFCVNYSFFNNKVCLKCIPKKRFFCIIKGKCLKNSYIYSIGASISRLIRNPLTVYERVVKKYIAPTTFVADILMTAGINHSKIVHIPYPDDKYINNKLSGGYVLYLGGLDKKKGIELVLKAASVLPSIKFVLAGRKNCCPESDKYFTRLKKMENVTYKGYLDAKSTELENLYKDAAFIVVPSLWPEVACLVAKEASAHQKPVIASNMGGLSETLRSNKNAVFFDPANIDEFIKKVKELSFNMRTVRKVKDSLTETPQSHLDSIYALYNSVLVKK